MRTTNKKQGFTNVKGFTLVELVIVIAVIAILAGVLIPTFSNVVENAKNAAFKSDATNLYKQYVTEVAHTGKVEKNLIIYGGDNKYIVYKDGKQLDDVYDIKTAKQELGIPQTKALDVIDGFEDILVDTDKTLVRVKSVGQLFDGAKMVITCTKDEKNYAMGTQMNSDSSGYMDAIEVEISNETGNITVVSEQQKSYITIALKYNGNTKSWSLMVDNEYIKYYKSDQTHLCYDSQQSEQCNWIFEKIENIIEIRAEQKMEQTRYIRYKYNSGEDRFGFYLKDNSPIIYLINE